MSTLRGALVMVLALSAEEVLVSSRGGPELVSGVGGGVARFIQRLADPTLPLIGSSSPSTKPTSTTTTTTKPAKPAKS